MTIMDMMARYKAGETSDDVALALNNDPRGLEYVPTDLAFIISGITRLQYHMFVEYPENSDIFGILN